MLRGMIKYRLKVGRGDRYLIEKVKGPENFLQDGCCIPNRYDDRGRRESVKYPSHWRSNDGRRVLHRAFYSHGHWVSWPLMSSMKAAAWHRRCRFPSPDPGGSAAEVNGATGS